MKAPRHLFNLNQISTTDLMILIRQAIKIKHIGIQDLTTVFTHLRGRLLANLFFEPSTRTLYSFASAAHRLGMRVINFSAPSSSLQKQESQLDTIRCFVDFGTDLIVIRSPQERYYQQLKSIATPMINAGDGAGSHPTQVLLDLMTIFETFNTFKNLTVLIVGDIKHSRVAKSHYKVLTRLGMKVSVAGPGILAEPNLNNIFRSEMIDWSNYDVIFLLRYQFERHANRSVQLKPKVVLRDWGLTVARHARLKSNAIIIHPGPVNWGFEIARELERSSHLRVRTQVQNGVYMRIALIVWMLSDD